MQVSTQNGIFSLYGDLPDRCPFCHNSITPNVLYGYNGIRLEVLMYCPDRNCGRSFIAYYEKRANVSIADSTGETSIGTLISKTFSDRINEISPPFVIIYNQAFAAEQQGLTEVCGVGYRKALEFLIKDYSTLNNTSDKEKIEKMLLANVIESYVNDSKIKSVSKRAVWLGNDETHYVRKWEGKDLNDLKKLIDLTVHWMEMEALTKSFETEMPE